MFDTQLCKPRRTYVGRACSMFHLESAESPLVAGVGLACSHRAPIVAVVCPLARHTCRGGACVTIVVSIIVVIVLSRTRRGGEREASIVDAVLSTGCRGMQGRYGPAEAVGRDGDLTKRRGDGRWKMEDGRCNMSPKFFFPESIWQHDTGIPRVQPPPSFLEHIKYVSLARCFPDTSEAPGWNNSGPMS